MSTIFDRQGNTHRAAGTAGAGQFAPHTHSAPPSGLAEVASEDLFDEAEWRERMEAVIAAG